MMLRGSLAKCVGSFGRMSAPSVVGVSKGQSCESSTWSWREYFDSGKTAGGPDYYKYRAGPSNLPNTWPSKKCEFQDLTMIKDGEAPRGPQAAYPNLKYHLPYDTSNYRCFLVPEAYFTFLHERTGVLGPYILMWGGLATLFSKEFIIVNEEFSAAAMWFIMPMYIASKIGGGIDKSYREQHNTQMLTLEKLKKSKIEQYMNEADALEEDNKRAEMGREVFQAYSANVDNMIEAEYRQRQDQVYQSFKRRLDYQLALKSLEEGLVQRQLVAWVKQEVKKTLKATPQKESINQCLKDLKALAATSPAL